MSGSRPPREDGKARGEGGRRPGLRDRGGAALAAAPRVLSACRADTRAGLALTDEGTAALNSLHGGLAGPNTCTALGGQSRGLGTLLGLALGPRPVTLGHGLLWVVLVCSRQWGLRDHPPLDDITVARAAAL